MEIVYFTLAAVVLYFVADWALDRVEVMAGRRIPYRGIVFFAILLVLAVSSFSLIRYFAGGGGPG